MSFDTHDLITHSKKKINQIHNIVLIRNKGEIAYFENENNHKEFKKTNFRIEFKKAISINPIHSKTTTKNEK